MSYTAITRSVAEDLDDRCGGTLDVVVMDGIPATGKSSLAEALAGHLRDLGRDVVCIENDWFIDRSIRSPAAIARGFALALSGLGQGDLEQRLLSRFLDQRRLGAFQAALDRARADLADTGESVLRPEGAYWNLHDPRPWHDDPAAAGFTVRPGTIVLIEGTLTAATHVARFPDLVSILVRVPPSVARQRFVERNKDPRRRRNLAFSALALTTMPFRIAGELIERRAYDIEVDLTSWSAPAFQIVQPTMG